MKELIAQQPTPQGMVKIHLRIMGKLLFFKFNKSEQALSLLEQMKAKGADIEQGDKWIKVNMFKNHTLVKLGGNEFDVTTIKQEDLEKILFNFYSDKYKEAHYKVKEVK